MNSINPILLCLGFQVFSGIIQIIQCQITSPHRPHASWKMQKKWYMMLRCFTLSWWFRCGSLKIVPPFTKGDDKAISLNEDGPFRGLPWYAILHREGIVQWVGLFWQFHFRDPNQRMNKTLFKCDVSTSLVDINTRNILIPKFLPSNQ